MNSAQPGPPSMCHPTERFRGLLVDAAVAQIDIAILVQLAGEFDDLGMQDDLHEWQGVIEGAPVRIFHLRPQVKVIPLATVCRPFRWILGSLFDRGYARLGETFGERTGDDDVAFSAVLLQLFLR